MSSPEIYHAKIFPFMRMCQRITGKIDGLELQDVALPIEPTTCFCHPAPFQTSHCMTCVVDTGPSGASETRDCPFTPSFIRSVGLVIVGETGVMYVNDRCRANQWRNGTRPRGPPDAGSIGLEAIGSQGNDSVSR